MPLYEYECSQCGQIEEVLQSFSDKPLKKCRHCQGKLHKLISQSSFHLKGTGWYVTDYAGKKGQNPHGKSDSTSPARESNSGASSDSSDSKPASSAAKT